LKTFRNALCRIRQHLSRALEIHRGLAAPRDMRSVSSVHATIAHQAAAYMPIADETETMQEKIRNSTASDAVGPMLYMNAPTCPDAQGCCISTGFTPRSGKVPSAT